MIIPSEQFIKLFKETPGAISVCEAIAIFNIAKEAPAGINMDLGSHAGKAAMSAAHGLPKGSLMMVDPCYDLTNEEAWKHSVQRDPKNMPWWYVAEPDFLEKVKNRIFFASSSTVTPILKGDFSENIIPQYSGYSYVFIDSDDHCGGMAIREAKLLEDRMVEGGIIAFHDYYNQFQDPKDAYDYLLSTGKFQAIHIPWDEIFDFVRAGNLEEGNDSWHQSGSNEFPKYVGALKRK